MEICLWNRKTSVIQFTTITVFLFFLFILSIGNITLAGELKPPQFIAQWGKKGTDPGQFYRPVGIAVDQKGFVYVSDTENQRIQKFSTDGTFITSWGKAGEG